MVRNREQYLCFLGKRIVNDPLGPLLNARILNCRARVDVHRKENVGSTEKAITIYGQPENCTKACAEILKVMREEAKTAAKAAAEEEGVGEGERGDEGEPEDMVSLKVSHSILILASFNV